MSRHYGLNPPAIISGHRAAMAVTAIGLSLSALTALGQVQDGQPPNARRSVSPALEINHPPDRQQQLRQLDPRGGERGYRSYDGSNNNRQAPGIGAVGSQLLRIVDPDYSDGLSSLAGPERPSPRAVSNAVFSQDYSIPNDRNTSDYLWQWGQFLDHDIDLTDGVDPAEPADIEVPEGDEYFDPLFTGEQVIAFNRSIYDPQTGISAPRQQLNEISAWIDASNVYGSGKERADALRSLSGDGKLKTSEGELLPFNTEGLVNAGGESAALFLAGDVRANEQVGLATLHTLFVREHNRLADMIAESNPELVGEEVYQRARRLVGAEMQVITYREYLPALLGPGALPPYRGYDPELDGSIANSFSGAAYRYGHSALNETLQRLDGFGQETFHGHLALRDAFFNPSALVDEGGIEPVLRGLARQASQKIDARVIDDVRNFLFGTPGSGGFDLVSLNIQRGRDHGLPSYNDTREAMGFPRARDFFDITSDFDTRARLATVYNSVDEVDLWVGGLSEDTVPGSQLGPLFHHIVRDQFVALREGDRFWYSRHLTPEERDMVEGLRLADIIRLNTGIGGEIQDDVFHVRMPVDGDSPPLRDNRNLRRR